MSSSQDRNAFRLRFDVDEARLGWLPKLLDSYAIIDEGVAEAIAEHEEVQGSRLACRRGCANCCRFQRDIPVYPHELVGIYWYATEKIEGPERETLIKQLKAHGAKSPCPFLVGDLCSIHPLRPTACRQFNVFGRPCARNEDPFFNRREDVLTPKQEYTDRAFEKMLFFYGFKKDMDVATMVADIIHNQVRNLRDIEWARLAEMMEGTSPGG